LIAKTRFVVLEIHDLSPTEKGNERKMAKGNANAIPTAYGDSREIYVAP
jgi:hypothetical protein